jgi:hypothetical protein
VHNIHGIKHKQSRTLHDQPRTANQGGQEETNQDEMAIIISDPHPQQNLEAWQHNEDFHPDEKLQQIRRRMKKSKISMEDISAAAAWQPHQEP